MMKSSNVKQRILSILIILALVFSMLPITDVTAANEVIKCETEGCDAEYENGKCYKKHLQAAVQTTDKYDMDGDGNTDLVYEIGNGGQLLWFAQKVNSGEVDLNAVLIDDVTMLLDVWPAIGNLSNHYAGQFDGKNHTVTCRTNAIVIKDYYGLFGCSDGAIKNVKIAEFCFNAVNSYSCVGAVCGYNLGTISGCSLKNNASGTMTKLSRIGGIVGLNEKSGVISYCMTNAGIHANDRVGGIVGRNIGRIENCTSNGTVTASEARTGGIAGENFGTIIECTSNVTMSSYNGVQYIGGIAGANGRYGINDISNIKNCVSNVKMTNSIDHRCVGGIVGHNDTNCIVTACENTADIDASRSTYVACISGYNDGIISECYNSGSIRGSSPESDWNIGGIVGRNSSNGEIKNCGNSGSVSAVYLGGIAGSNSGAISHCCFTGTLVNSSYSGVCWNDATIEQVYYNTGTFCRENVGTITNTLKATDEQMKSGQVTYLLNGQKANAEVIWRQTIGKDSCPVLAKTSAIVYQTSPCVTYINTEPAGEKQHNYVRGVCTECRYAEELSLNKEGVYEIDTLEKLLTFADHVNAGQCSVNAKLTADIDISSVADFGIGKNTGVAYKGTFDGNGRTLTVNLISQAEYTAPFPYVHGANIKNLTVEGTITTTHKFAASIVGRVAGGNVTLDGCISHVAIISNMGSEEEVADGTHGGLVGVAGGGTLKIIRCAFRGSITGANTTSCGGVVGWSDITTRITDSYVAATFSLKDNSGNTFARNKVNLTNCYYQNALSDTPTAGATQKGKEAFSTGEVTWLLNGKSPNGAWKQTLGVGKDDYPNFTGKTVYGIPTDCGGKNASGYVNTEQTALAHSYDKNGLCRETEGEVHYQPAPYQDGRYEISNIGQFVWFSDFVNTKVGDAYPNQKADAVLKCDIDLSDITGYVPIGGTTGLYYTAEGTDKGYQGTFDGCGHVIRNLTITGSDSAERTYGVFGTLSGTIKHLGVENFTFTVGSKDCRVGGLVGQMLTGSLVKNCYVTDAKIETTNKVAGGLAGCNYAGTIENCITYNVTITATRYGGIVGDNCDDNDNGRKGTVKNCYTNAETIQSDDRQGTVYDSVANAKLSTGEIAYKLNGSTSEGNLIWYQTLGTDAFPKFNGKRVYKVEEIYINAQNVTITGVTTESVTYDGLAHKGYVGNPTNADGYTGTYEVTYTGRNGTDYHSSEAPKNAGDYTVIISTDSQVDSYSGYISIDFTIDRKNIELKCQTQKLSKGEELRKEKVTVGAVLSGHTVSVIALNKEESCKYSVTIEVKDANGNDVTTNYTYNKRGIYHEYAWETSNHTYKCIHCTDVYQTDHDMPTAEYKIGTNGFKKFINTISFGLFCKDYQTVSITASDETSGIKYIEYYISNKEITSAELETVTWKQYENGLSLAAKGTYFIYVRVADNAGNTAVYNSEGIVIFEDSTAKVQIEYTRTTMQPVTAAIAFNGNTVNQVTYKDQILTEETDYTVNENGIVFTVEFLETLSASVNAHLVTVSYNAGGVEWNEETSYGTEPTDTVIAIAVKRTSGSVTNISDVNKIYDGLPVSNPTYIAESTGEVTYEYKVFGAEDSTYTTDAPKDAGKYIVRVTVAADENYDQVSDTKEFSITKAKITITAKNDKKIYGEQDPILEYSITSGALFGSDILENLSIERDKGENVKTYTITIGQTEGANPNYDISFVDGTFTINKKTIGISWGVTDFTYNGETKLPTATATGVVGNDKIGLIVTGGQINAGTGYTATVTDIIGDMTDNYQLPADVTTTFHIAKADQSAPSGLVGTPEDIDGRKNGTITGVTSAMEYRKNEETSYTAITGTKLTNLADGTYYIRYKADGNHNASPETKVVLSNNMKLKVTVPTTQVGYILIVDKTKLVYGESVTLSFTLKEGYSKQSDFVVKVNGISISLNDNGKYTVNNAQEDIDITVDGVADITTPTAEITLRENKWNKFWNNVTFGLFFKETQKVIITAEDKGSGVDKVYYFLSETELTEEQVKAFSSDKWTEYTGEFNLNPQDEYIIYAKAVDKANNAIYISSDKTIIIDNIAPVISGIADGENHYGDTTFTITDKHIDVVKVDGTPVTLTGGKYTITADGKQHTIIATDKSGNASAEIKITVITIASLDDSIDGITIDNVKSSDKKAIEDVQSFINGLIVGGKDFTDAEDAELVNMKANTEALLNKIASVSSETDNTDKVKDITSDNVETKDKTDLEKAKDDLEKALEDYKDNLKDDEKKDIQDEINRIEKALEVIDKVEKVEDLINKLPDTIAKSDADVIKKADEVYNALSKYEQSILDKDTKKKLDNAKSTLETLNKATNSPVTGDNGSIWMWFVLLFVSGGGLMGTTVFGRKRKYTTK